MTTSLSLQIQNLRQSNDRLHQQNQQLTTERDRYRNERNQLNQLVQGYRTAAFNQQQRVQQLA